ncbi:hypothetical protein ACLVWQ_39050 [Streptomyces sp. CWNU-52B]|uniref:hypothetical protein n=1 Tax=unclassified Streptomyces TaxID=2593676 RepID=UPI0039BF155C
MHEATRAVISLVDTGPSVTTTWDPTTPYSQDGTPVAFIDLDMAQPGSPLDDVSYPAWLWCVPQKENTPSVDVQAAQIRVPADAYGLVDPARGGIGAMAARSGFVAATARG